MRVGLAFDGSVAEDLFGEGKMRKQARMEIFFVALDRACDEAQASIQRGKRGFRMRIQ